MRDHSALLGHLFQKYIPCLCSHIDVLDTQACEIHSSKHEEGIKEEKKVYDFLLGRRRTTSSQRLSRSLNVRCRMKIVCDCPNDHSFCSLAVTCGTVGSGHYEKQGFQVKPRFLIEFLVVLSRRLSFTVSWLVSCLRNPQFLAGVEIEEMHICDGQMLNRKQWGKQKQFRSQFYVPFSCCSLLKRILTTRAIIFPKHMYVCPRLFRLQLSKIVMHRIFAMLGHLHFDYIFCGNVVPYTQFRVVFHPSGWKDASTSD